MTIAENTPLNGIAPLPHLGVIQVLGDDAAAFLHGQLTQDFLLLDSQQARLAAYCSPKGRMLASFIGFKRGANDILLICNRDILAASLKRLSMFVMRAKVKLLDASDQLQVHGLAGDAIKLIAKNSIPHWSRVEFNAINGIMLYPADSTPRALWIAPVGEPLPDGSALSEAVWLWGEVRSGVASISAPIVDAFVPQMLNYESVGGVNFKKGCYPGQEVVARSQFRGTLKRRTYLMHSEVLLTAGQEIFASNDDAQPCGQVVQAAASPLGGFDALVCAQVAVVEAVDEAKNNPTLPPLDLRLGQAQGSKLTRLPLPYPLVADI